MNVNKILLLNKRQWRENNKSYRTGLLAITGILLFLFLVVWHWRDSFAGDVHRGIFLIGLFAGGCIFGSSLLKDIRDSSKGMWLMCIPASSGEKVFITVLYATALYMIAYLILFSVTEGLFLWMVKQSGYAIARTDLFLNGFYNFLYTFVSFQLFILIGCMVFKRGALLKTILLMIIYFAIASKANNYLLTIITRQKEIDGGSLYSYFQFRHGGENVYVYLPDNVQTVTTLVFNFLLPATLYYIIYLKFRETEI